MKQNLFVANRLKEVLLNGQWVANTNYKEQLLSITWKQAVQKVNNLNTIAALTFHINYYMEGLLKVFNGGPLNISDKYSFNMPPVKCEDDWKKLVADFLNNAEAFINHVSKMTYDTLNEIFIDEKYGTYLRNIEGVIEHSYYHLGQISLIKKMILSNEDKIT